MESPFLIGAENYLSHFRVNVVVFQLKYINCRSLFYMFQSLDLLAFRRDRARARSA